MDRHFKNKLNNVSINWDKAQLWEELEPKLPRRNARKRSFILFLSFLLVSTLLFWYAIHIYKSSINITTPNSSTSIASGYSASTKASLDFIIDTITACSSIPENLAVTHTKAPDTNDPLDSIINTITLSNSTFPKNATITSANSSTTELKSTPSEFTSSLPSLPQSSPIALLPFEQALLTYDFSTDLMNYQLQSLQSDRYSTDCVGLFTQFSIGAGITQRSAASNEPDEDTNTQILENKVLETPRNLFTIAFEVGYRFRNGLTIQSGIHQNRIHELFKWEKLLTVDTIQALSSMGFYTPMGQDTTFYEGPVTRVNSQTRQVIHNNFTTAWVIPFQLGYEKQFGRIRLQPSIGLQFWFKEKYVGKVLSIEGSILENPDIQLISRTAFKLGLGASYEFMKKSDLFINTAFSNTPSFNMNSVDMTYRTFSAHLGIRVVL